SPSDPIENQSNPFKIGTDRCLSEVNKSIWKYFEAFLIQIQGGDEVIVSENRPLEMLLGGILPLADCHFKMQITLNQSSNNITDIQNCCLENVIDAKKSGPIKGN